MKSLMKLTARGAVAGLGLLALSNAAQAASDSFDASAVIQTAINITTAQNLNFANIVPSATLADTVIVSPNGTRTCGTNLACSGTVTEAQFNITGTANSSYAITLPTGTSITDGGPNSMVVDTYTTTGGLTTRTLDGTGNDTFSVGATLNVTAGQATGNYSGTFSMEVNYN